MVATFSPLYDTVLELRVYGGYIETFVVMLLLLLTVLKLMDRWREGASSNELSGYWALSGFLVGLGLWIDPLVMYTVVAIAIWVICGIVRMLPPLRELLLTLVALPTSLLGFLPGIYWGNKNHWANITYILQQSSHDPFLVRLQTS